MPAASVRSTVCSVHVCWGPVQPSTLRPAARHQNCHCICGLPCARRSGGHPGCFSRSNTAGMLLGDIEAQLAHGLLDRCTIALIANHLRLPVALFAVLGLAPQRADDTRPANHIVDSDTISGRQCIEQTNLVVQAERLAPPPPHLLFSPHTFQKELFAAKKSCRARRQLFASVPPASHTSLQVWCGRSSTTSARLRHRQPFERPHRFCGTQNCDQFLDGCKAWAAEGVEGMTRPSRSSDDLHRWRKPNTVSYVWIQDYSLANTPQLAAPSSAETAAMFSLDASAGRASAEQHQRGRYMCDMGYVWVNHIECNPWRWDGVAQLLVCAGSTVWEV